MFLSYVWVGNLQVRYVRVVSSPITDCKLYNNTSTTVVTLHEAARAKEDASIRSCAVSSGRGMGRQRSWSAFLDTTRLTPSSQSPRHLGGHRNEILAEGTQLTYTFIYVRIQIIYIYIYIYNRSYVEAM